MWQVHARASSTPLIWQWLSEDLRWLRHPFVIREGRAEAIVGPDDQLYCYGTACDEAAFAAPAIALKRAS